MAIDRLWGKTSYFDSRECWEQESWFNGWDLPDDYVGYEERLRRRFWPRSTRESSHGL